MFKEHMIFLEDEPSVRTNIAEELRNRYPNWQIQTAACLNEAKSLLLNSKRHGFITRVVIVDEVLEIGGQEERGSDFLAYVHRKYPGIRKIMFTARAKRPDITQALNECSLDKCIIKQDFRDDHSLLFNAIDDSLREEDRSVIYHGLAEFLNRALEQGLADKAIFMAGQKEIGPGELLRHICQETTLGKKHMKQFTQFLYSIFLEPDKFLEELGRRKKLQRKSSKKAKSVKKKSKVRR